MIQSVKDFFVVILIVMELHCIDIHLSPATFKQVEALAAKLNISHEEVINKALQFYCKHQGAYFQGQEVVIVFESPNPSFESLINNFWGYVFN